MYYDQLTILIHLQRTGSPGLDELDLETDALPDTLESPRHDDCVLYTAAQQLTTMITALVPNQLLFVLPHDTYMSIFAAQVVFLLRIIRIRRHHRYPAAKDAEIAARAQLMTCQTIMHLILDIWDSAAWTTRLFNRLLANISAASAATPARHLQAANNHEESCSADTLENSHTMHQGGDLNTTHTNLDFSTITDVQCVDLPQGDVGLEHPSYLFQDSFYDMWFKEDDFPGLFTG
ncbi:uncharacterized protein PV07_04109 [Cladophialophora immunda]|uniref:Transcription factor domain-containing protein n=1 Tax=Cladophialophora immunda TaxID=569365 RepID=A0A0D2DA67_9EURO|nr:uncharacterized protein PV07_04109 [Cladophialophora immunda]KIW32579.1 hypothetical protein PV07_04109 [Cladophialophora immunda]OQU98934.1 hypothetical protein CLAIMM_04643 [Cladophialophora immunda]